MDDLVSVIVAIVVFYLIGKSTRKRGEFKKGGSGGPAIPYTDAQHKGQSESPAAGRASQPGGMNAQRQAQFEEDMHKIKERAREKLDARRQGQPRQPGAAAASGFDEMQPRTAPQTVSYEGAMEGVDPCHDEMYPHTARAGEDDAYAFTAQEEENAAAQELMRGIVLSEILKRPDQGWRTLHR